MSVLAIIALVIAYFTVGFIAARIVRPYHVRVHITEETDKSRLIGESHYMPGAHADIWSRQQKVVWFWPIALPHDLHKDSINKACNAANHAQRAYVLELMEKDMEEERKKELEQEESAS
jgi:hypothetical protein